MKFLLGRLGGRERSMLRHLERRGPQTHDQLLKHYVDGAHGWHPEDLDRVLGHLVQSGILFEPGGDGLYRRTVRSPL